jgi:methyl-accepting chemotaxis protein
MTTNDPGSAAFDRARGQGVRSLFAPAIWAMNRLRYAQKFVLIGTVIFVPFALVTWLQGQGSIKQEVFNQKESWGVAYISPLKDFLRYVQRSRLLAATVATGQTGLRDELAQAQASADRVISEVDAQDATYGRELGTTKAWDAVKVEWAGVKKAELRTPADVSAAYDKIGAMVIDIILNQAGNNSNLILDPDLDSYWLMDAFVVKLPALTETLDKAAALAASAAAKGTMTGEERMQLAGFHALADSMVSDLVNVNMRTAYKYQEDNGKGAVLKKALDDDVRKAQERVAEFLILLRASVLVPDKPTAALVDIRQMERAAQDQLYSLYGRIGPQLDDLVQVRVADYRRQRQTALLSAAIGAIVLLWMFIGFYLSVRGSVLGLTRATERMIHGTPETFRLDSADELGGLAGSYNEINGALNEARSLRTRVEEQNVELRENIASILRVMSEAADGKLGVRAEVSETANAEIKRLAAAFNSFMDSLSGIVKSIVESMSKLSSGTTEISAASNQVAAGAESQTQQVIRTSTAMEEMSASIKEVARNAHFTATATETAASRADQGRAKVQNALKGLAGTNTSLQQLLQRSAEIDHVVKLISDIAAQTNILALNAAIEAAGAGAAGARFDVVAEEIRKLAGRTAESTARISATVAEVQREMQTAAERMQMTSTEAEEIGRSFDDIVQGIGSIKEMMNQIKTSTSEQAKGAEQVAEALQLITRVSQQTAQATRETSITIDDLSGVADHMSGTVGRFTL